MLSSEYSGDTNGIPQMPVHLIPGSGMWSRRKCPSKTKFILFRTRGKPIDDNNISIEFNDNEPNSADNPNLIFPLARVFDNNPNSNHRTYKLLGNQLDEYLNLNQHVSQICSKLSRALFQIRKANFFLPPPCFKDTIYGVVSLSLIVLHKHYQYYIPNQYKQNPFCPKESH